MGFFQRRREAKIQKIKEDIQNAEAAGDLQSALGAVNRLLDLDFQNADAFLKKAALLRETGQAAESRELLENLVQWENPEIRKKAGFELALRSTNAGLWESAWARLGQEPPEGKTLSWLGASLRCCFEMNNPERFQQLVDEYWTEPDSGSLTTEDKLHVAKIHLALALFEEQMKLSDLEVIQKHLDTALELDPENTEAEKFSRELGSDSRRVVVPKKVEDEEQDGVALAPERLHLMLLLPEDQAAWETALELLEDDGRLFQDPSWLRLELARQSLIQGNPTRAVQLLESLIPSSDQETLWQGLLGHGKKHLKAPEKAAQLPEELQPEEAEEAHDAILSEPFFQVATGGFAEARALLEDKMTELTGEALAAAQFLLGLAHLGERDFQSAVTVLNSLRENSTLRALAFPRLVLAHSLAKDQEGLEWTFEQWEDWFQKALDSGNPGAIVWIEGSLAEYLEIGASLGHLSSFKLQAWKSSLLEQGLAASSVFQLLFEADTEIRERREGAQVRQAEIMERYGARPQPEVFALLHPMTLN